MAATHDCGLYWPVPMPMKIVGIKHKTLDKTLPGQCSGTGTLFRTTVPVPEHSPDLELEQLDCAELTCLVMGSLSCIKYFWRLAGKHNKIDPKAVHCAGHFPGTYAIFPTALAIP